MKFLPLLFVSVFSAITNAAECLHTFNNEIALSKTTKGNVIHFPFDYKYLTQGDFEPLLNHKILDQASRHELLKILKSSYQYVTTTKVNKLVQTQGEEIHVIFSGIDNGYNIKYRFMVINGCWQLIGFSNNST